jgi:hypothetical protein
VPNGAIYISDDDEAVWRQAQCLLPFYQGKSFSAFVVEQAREHVKEENSSHAHGSGVKHRV